MNEAPAGSPASDRDIDGTTWHCTQVCIKYVKYAHMRARRTAPFRAYVCVCGCACVRVCMRACMRARVRACRRLALRFGRVLTPACSHCRNGIDDYPSQLDVMVAVLCKPSRA